MSQEQRKQVREHGAEVWIDDPLPGGWVCAACGVPTESEPCDEHYPEIGDKRWHQWKRLFKAEQGTLCGQPATHAVFTEFRIVNMVSDPSKVNCNDCLYLMEQIEAGRVAYA